MLTCASFYQLIYSEQADLLLKKGTFLYCRNEGNFIIDLYELDELLIEIFYRKENDEPVSVMAYNTKDKLKSLAPGTLQPRLTIKNTAHLQKSNFAA